MAAGTLQACGLALRSLLLRGPVSGGLGDGGAMAIAAKGPAVVGAFQLAIVVEPSFREGHQTVGAYICKGTPLLAGLIPPQHEVIAEQGEGGGAATIEIGQIGHGVPAAPPRGLRRCAGRVRNPGGGDGGRHGWMANLNQARTLACSHHGAVLSRPLAEDELAALASLPSRGWWRCPGDGMNC